MQDSSKNTLAKSFTELAIQNGIFSSFKDPEEAARQIANFYNTIIKNIGKNDDQ